MEVVLENKRANGAILRYVSMDKSDLLKYVDWGKPTNSSVYVWVIPNIYNNGYSIYIGKGVYNEKFEFEPYASSRAINHYNDPLYRAIQEVGPEKCVCNIYVGITEEEACAFEAALLKMDERCGLSYGQCKWEGEPLLNKRNEDVDMQLIDKYFDLDGNNNIKTFRRKMYRY